jgi:hypothetical protein
MAGFFFFVKVTGWNEKEFIIPGPMSWATGSGLTSAAMSGFFMRRRVLVALLVSLVTRNTPLFVLCSIHSLLGILYLCMHF